MCCMSLHEQQAESFEGLPCCLLPAPQAMDRHGLALEQKPEVARVVMDDVAPALRLLQGMLALPTSVDIRHQPTNSTSAPFGGTRDACCRCGLEWHMTADLWQRFMKHGRNGCGVVAAVWVGLLVVAVHCHKLNRMSVPGCRGNLRLFWQSTWHVQLLCGRRLPAIRWLVHWGDCWRHFLQSCWRRWPAHHRRMCRWWASWARPRRHPCHMPSRRASDSIKPCV